MFRLQLLRRRLERSGAGSLAAAREDSRERRGVDRLRQMRIEPGIERPLLVLRLAPACHGDDDDVLLARLPSNSPTRFVSVYARHADVQEHDVRFKLLDYCKAAHGIVSHSRRASELFDEHRHRLSSVLVVIDDDDAARDMRHVDR
jgi:hypothetical protein